MLVRNLAVIAGIVAVVGENAESRLPAWTPLRPPAVTTLRSGERLQSLELPVIGSGMVHLTDLAGTVKLIPLDMVDLTASRKDWAGVGPWHSLDTSPYQGRKLPPLSIVAASGTPETLRTTGLGFQVVALWRMYCASCGQQLQSAKRTLATLGERPPVVATVIGIADTKRAWSSAVRKHGLHDEPGWRVVWAPEEGTWMDAIGRGSSLVILLLDDDGFVRHSFLWPSTGSDNRADTFGITIRSELAAELAATGGQR